MASERKQKRRSERFKKHIAKLIEDGEMPAHLAELYDIPYSTICFWHNEYKPQAKGESFSAVDFRRMKKRIERTETKLHVLQNSPFIQNADLRERMEYMEYILKNDESGKITPELLTEAFSVDKSTFRHFRMDSKREDAYFVKRRKELETYITKIYLDSNRKYGARKVHYLLREKYHLRVSEKYVRKIMRELGYVGATPRQIKRELRERSKEYYERRNLLKQNFRAKKPNQIWLSDCKHFTGEKGKRYTICTIEDKYGDRVAAFSIGLTENTNIVCKTIRKAIATRNISDNVIFHSDNGSAYSSIRTNYLLRQHGFVHSYSASSNPFDDAPGESFFSHFSSEILADTVSRMPFRSERDMRKRVAEYVDFYNNERPHESNDYLTPKQKEAQYEGRHKMKVDNR